MHLLDVRADLAQCDREQVELLEADGLVGRHQHSAALVQLDKIALGLDLRCGDACALRDLHQLLVLLGRDGIDAAIVHGVDGRGRRGDLRQDVVLLHALTDGARDILREQDARFHRAEEFLHRIGIRALGADVEALKLTLESVGALQCRALVAFAGVELLQHLREGLAALAVHALFQLDRIKTHDISPFFSYRNSPSVFAAASTCTIRQPLPPLVTLLTPPSPSAPSVA